MHCILDLVQLSQLQQLLMIFVVTCYCTGLPEWPLANSFSSPRLLVSLKMVNLNFYCIAGSLFIEFR